ncbi:hypothetical protein YC2023_080089 [Brassica napus]|uniref:(rape) hypothetical protein n=1 Tax=Brassica napus TaxID=3708 RepID=A0A816QP06_BRANA|nr:unnamed protein product [Brassica napus]
MIAGELGLEQKEEHNEHVPTLMEVMRAIEILNAKVALMIMNKKNPEENETNKTADRHTSKATEGNTFLKRREAPIRRQVDIPVFTGENPQVWVLQAVPFSEWKMFSRGCSELKHFQFTHKARISFHTTYCIPSLNPSH